MARSDEYLSSLYPPESNHAEPLEALIGDDSAFFVAYMDDVPAACGGVKVFEDDIKYGELKRIYVDENQRGKRLGIEVVRHLEDHLSNDGVKVVRLEAGPMQPEALGLYRKLGYYERGPFGSYRADPLSVFMEKTLRD